MTQVHDVPDDWNPNHRCCLECGNSDPDVTLRALTHPATNQQALACTRHLADVAAVLASYEPAHLAEEQRAPKPSTTPTAPSTPATRRSPSA
ncbi:hypothetical protein [Streptomyces sp. NPDC026589]|uniref:hypothetical protein n=1 Tax=Streptomyces sp. NPDC026589 TaxID=3155609 RepID=UPI0033E82806